MMRLLFLIYRRLISPALEVGFGVRCRYDESCSRYAERRISEAGFLIGGRDGIRRILSCSGYTSAAQHSELENGS